MRLFVPFYGFFSVLFYFLSSFVVRRFRFRSFHTKIDAIQIKEKNGGNYDRVNIKNENQNDNGDGHVGVDVGRQEQ